MRSRGPVWAQRGHLAGGRTATVLCHGSRSTSCEGRHVLPWMHGATDKCARRARSRSARGLQNTAREFVEKSKIESCLKQRATCTVDRPGQRKKKKSHKHRLGKRLSCMAVAYVHEDRGRNRRVTRRTVQYVCACERAWCMHVLARAPAPVSSVRFENGMDRELGMAVLT